MLDISKIEKTMGEFVYYIVEQDKFWIAWWNIGNFKTKDHFGKRTYIYIGEL